MDDFILDEEDILRHVDEYTIYCHYLGFDPDISIKYSSPIRPDDDDPSFGIFPSRFIPGREYLWKDQAKGVSGDVFKLVRLILEQRWGACSKYQAAAHVKAEFGLGPSLTDSKPLVIKRDKPVLRDPMLIRVKSRAFSAADLAFWKQFNISTEILERYYVKSISCYWTYEAQSVPKFPRGLGFAYYVMGKYKLYFPEERKEFKFRNDMTERELEGFQQLKYKSSTLIITKSLKDVMCLDSFGYEAVAARSENTVIDPHYLRWFEGHYKRIIVLFDNDGKHKADEYTYPKVWIPPDSGEKDISDFCKRYGAALTQDLLYQLLGYAPNDKRGS